MSSSKSIERQRWRRCGSLSSGGCLWLDLSARRKRAKARTLTTATAVHRQRLSAISSIMMMLAFAVTFSNGFVSHHHHTCHRLSQHEDIVTRRQPFSRRRLRNEPSYSTNRALVVLIQKYDSIGDEWQPTPFYRRRERKVNKKNSEKYGLGTSTTGRGYENTPNFLGYDKYEERYDGSTKLFLPGWMQWMMGGKPRGTNRVILRQAAELGGLPRSDRYSSRDWWHNTVTLPNSEILREIKSPVVAITAWATAISVIHQLLIWSQHHHQLAQFLYIPTTTPHSVMMSALGLLLVFRTNSAYQRFSEGRVIWENIINTARDFYRIITMYEDQIGTERRQRLQQLLAAFPYLLRHRIRANLAIHKVDQPVASQEELNVDPKHSILLYQDTSPDDNDPEAAVVAQAEEEKEVKNDRSGGRDGPFALGSGLTNNAAKRNSQSRHSSKHGHRKARQLYFVDKRSLPWRLLPDQDTLEKCAGAQNRPLWICDRMAQEIRNVPENGTQFTARERLAMLAKVDQLSHCIGAAERIHQTVVPLKYARHTLRALTLWLLSLPFALVKDLKLLTAPLVFLMSWLLFGVYEIGYSIEDPFQGSLRLSILCDTIRRDVLGDELIRKSAFEINQATADPNATNPSSPSTTVPFVQRSISTDPLLLLSRQPYEDSDAYQ